MKQYKDPKGVLRPIPANYREETRKSDSDSAMPYENFIDMWSSCLCDGKELCKEFIPNKKPTLGATRGFCTYYALYPRGFCYLSRVNEVDLVNATQYEMLPLLIGTIQTELGIQELEKRFKTLKKE